MRNNNHSSVPTFRRAFLSPLGRVREGLPFLSLLGRAKEGLPLFLLLFLASCSSVDCPLNNTVYANYKLMGRVTTLTDPLTIWTNRNDGNDTILINQQVNTDSFTLPVSYARDRDTLFFRTNTTLDTVTIDKTNIPHFESVDCGMNYFHEVTGIHYTRNAIDSITIQNRDITYDTSKKHFYVYFKEYRY